VTSPREIFTAFKLNRLGAKVVFSPMQTTSGLGRKFKLILTLHDLIYYRHRTPPKEFNPFIRLAWFLYHLSYVPQRILLNGADAVVTVSKTSRSQIEKAKLTKRPVSVIYNASDLDSGEPANQAGSSYVHGEFHRVQKC
jgi:glycogen synthase